MIFKMLYLLENRISVNERRYVAVEAESFGKAVQKVTLNAIEKNLQIKDMNRVKNDNEDYYTFNLIGEENGVKFRCKIRNQELKII